MDARFIRFLYMSATIFFMIVVSFTLLTELNYIPNNQTNMLELVGLSAVLWFLMWQLNRRYSQ